MTTFFVLLLVFLLITEIPSYLVFGWYATKEITDMVMSADLSRAELLYVEQSGHTLLVCKGFFISQVSGISITSKYYIHSDGKSYRVLRTSELEKQIVKYYEDLNSPDNFKGA